MQKQTSNKQKSRRDQLPCHGDPPCRRLGLIHVLADPVIDPESDHGSDLVCNLEKSGQYSADGGNGEFSNVAGDAGGYASASEAG
jgi:hypothetical protein